jgi:hypothetical protein
VAAVGRWNAGATEPEEGGDAVRRTQSREAAAEVACAGEDEVGWFQKVESIYGCDWETDNRTAGEVELYSEQEHVRGTVLGTVN